MRRSTTFWGAWRQVEVAGESIARVTITIAEILSAIACVIEVTWIEIPGDLRWVQRTRQLSLFNSSFDGNTRRAILSILFAD